MSLTINQSNAAMPLGHSELDQVTQKAHGELKDNGLAGEVANYAIPYILEYGKDAVLKLIGSDESNKDSGEKSENEELKIGIATAAAGGAAYMATPAVMAAADYLAGGAMIAAIAGAGPVGAVLGGTAAACVIAAPYAAAVAGPLAGYAAKKLMNKVM